MWPLQDVGISMRVGLHGPDFTVIILKQRNQF